MLKLKIINQTFRKKTEKIYIQHLNDLFIFCANTKKWKDFKGKIILILTDNQSIQVLNQNYRQKNKPTDVLSFPYLNISEIQSNHKANLVIGEIFIAKEKSKQDAKDLSISLKEELSKLLVHGVLHILGFNHILDKDFFQMEKIEKELLKSFHKNNLSE